MQTVLSHLSPKDMVAFASTSFVNKNLVHNYMARWYTPNELELFWYAVFEGHVETYQWLLRTECSSIVTTALIAAAGKGYVDVIKLIFKRMIFKHVSDLHAAVAKKAAMYGHINVLRWIWNTKDFHKPMVHEMVMKKAYGAAIAGRRWYVLAWISDNSFGL
jgi:hypothetical protein